MKIHRVLLFCFLSALWDGNTGAVIFQRKEGKDFWGQWHLSSSDSVKFLCRRECKGEDVLIETPEDTAQNGRYSTEFTEGKLTVRITNLTKSDSGRYMCSLGSSLVSDSYRDFEIKVVDAQEEEINIHTADEGGEAVVVCYFSDTQSKKFICKNDCKEGNVLIETTEDQHHSGRYSIQYGEKSTGNLFLRMTITNLTKSDSGRYMCGLGSPLSPASIQRFEISVTTVTSDVSPPAFVLPVVICVCVAVVLLAGVLLFLHKRN
ncbi:polymeric immunoglobulin receptor-like isoform X5 [Anabas testudineus]|uniref:polymeric immunoglobulin receptor-like isoform X5 n=1 Tax=Anabas testudineus TaxID=64144 RepID=UPI000E462AF8|nr:polymeric immunoglobulin receptor-like isoform X5 [Anabas testudineus]